MRRRIARPRNIAATAVLAVVAALASPVQSAAAPPRAAEAEVEAEDYCQDQCHDILPPGANGNATLVDILLHKVFGTRPAHSADQLGPYADLVHGYPGLTEADLGRFFNDASFGVPADQVESTTKPRSDVTIVRDRKGIPHITGTTRSGTEFGAGYAAAQDRLWVMDVLRHVGRGQLTPFAGGAPSNRALEQRFFRVAPYTEAELQRQIDVLATSGDRGRQALADVRAYVEGVNTYIEQAHSGRYFPGEYVLTGKIDAITNAGKIEPFQLTDLVAIAAVVGGLFGGGGGGEVESALARQAAEARFGKAEGERVWRSFRESDDPEAVQTLHDGQRFPYATPPESPEGVAMPDPGSVVPEQLVYDPTGPTSTRRDPVRAPERLRPAQGMFDDGAVPADLLPERFGMSNALLVSGEHTDDGHPVAVFGPQTGYFAPQLLMLQELQGPGISARGASFAGISFYVQLGRGVDYSWSATSAGQDITDSYAVELCTTDGSPVTEDADAYRHRGECVPMDTVERRNEWKPTVADGTAAGSYRLVMHRTEYGLVTHRGTVGGKPVAFTAKRSTYLHEPDSIIGFQMLNDPGHSRSAKTFQEAAQKIGYAFNWFYADSEDIAYYNSGDNPDRPAYVDPGLPVKAEQRYQWLGFTPPAEHPQSVNQDFYISWNNKQADGYTSAGFGNGSVHRGNLLDTRVRQLLDDGGKAGLVSLVQAMEEAGLTDLRAEDVLPELLAVIRGAPVTDPDTKRAVEALESWRSAGGLRKETAPGSRSYAHSGAVRTMDAWWPLLVREVFAPGLGDDLYGKLTGLVQTGEAPSGVGHTGSAFLSGWWSYVDKDLRTVLGEPVEGGLARDFCGGGERGACRDTLLSTLKRAAAAPATEVYPGDGSCAAGDQWCADSIVQSPLGGITHDKTHWQNRPTYQQAVQFPDGRR